jgi:hypothetical protein
MAARLLTCFVRIRLVNASIWLETQMRSEDRESETREFEEMLLAGDAMLGLVHELNNALNTMMLQASVIELKAGEAIRSEVATIRQLGAQAASSLGFIARFRERYRQMKMRVDLNDAIRAVLTTEWATLHLASGHCVQPALFGEPLIIMAHPLALKQLLLVLLQIANSWYPGGPLGLFTKRADEQIWLVIGPSSKTSTDIIEAAWTDLGTEDENPLELFAAQSRARIVEAKLQMAVDDTGSRRIAAIWPTEGCTPPGVS